jgi:hypothetical protein
MKNKYIKISIQFLSFIVLIAVASSCKKDKTTTSVVDATPVTLGLFEQADSGAYRIFIPLSQIGTQSVNYDLIFDTGSAGLSLDAHGIIPDAMITNTGFNFTGDSTIVEGITITSKTGEMDYGDDVDETVVKGNVAYANVTINSNSGGLTIKRVAFFLYYAVYDVKNGNIAGETKLAGTHQVDVFGVSPEYSYASTLIQSPLYYYKPGTGLTNGFKLAKLISTDFISTGTYEQSILTIGLTSADLSSNGFIMHNCSYTSTDGYSPDVPGTVTYNNTNPSAGSKTISATFLFDTGTPITSIIEDKTLSEVETVPLSPGSSVTINTSEGFTYTYTTSVDNDLTTVENPNYTGDIRSILSLEFFIDNEYLTNYTGHQIGLKNN